MSGPIARPIAQRLPVRNLRPGVAFPANSTREDSASLRPNYITSDRLSRISQDMTDLDWTILSFVSLSRLASGNQLVGRFWFTDRESDPARARAARRTLKRLSGWRVLDPLPDRTRGGVRGGSGTLIYGVGVAGAKLLAARGLHQRRLGTPSERYIAHTLTATGLVVELHAADTRGELELIEVQQEPACWRAFLAGMGTRVVLKPDLFVRIGAGALEDRWMVECDLATEHKGTLLTKAKRYVAHYRSGSEQREHGVYPRVLWAVPDARRAEQIEGVLAHLPAPAERLFTVCVLDDVVAFMASEARS